MSIEFIKNKEFAVISTPDFQYIIEDYGPKNGERFLMSAYWGEALKNPEEALSFADIECWDEDRFTPTAYSSEFTGWGTKFYHQPTLKATFADGVRDLELRVIGSKLSDDKSTLTYTLKDRNYNFSVDVVYKTYENLSVIDRYCVIKNNEKEAVYLESVGSGTVNLPFAEEYYLTSMGSAWGKEYELARQKITPAATVLDARAGVSNAKNFPYFAIDKGNATELSGEVWFGTVQWSGNWKIAVETDYNKNIRITGGLNDFDFKWKLESGEEFTSPVMTIGYSAEGFSGASRILHDYIRKTTKATAWSSRPLPVLYNSWTCFEFDIDEQKEMELAEKAADMGIELFVIDDGWFATRDDIYSGLGDWYPSPKKFPNGLDPLINKVKSLGMMFGIWVEPEMVNPDSELYRAHPDWVINFPTRHREVSREQLILNLAREDVYNFVIDFLDDLLSNHSIDYLKWDMNRWFSQVGWPEMPNDRQQELWVRYVQNFYRVFEHLNEKFPNVILENCSSGGFRSDLAMSKWCTRINRSDNQDPVDELYLHEGFTYVNLSRSAGGAGHISASGTGLNERVSPMQFKAHIAMMGSMGIGIDLRTLNAEETEELRGYIAMQKELRSTVQLGDMYRLKTMRRDGVMAVEFVAKDKKEAVLFLFGPQTTFKHMWPELKLCGLNPDTVYKV